MVVLSKNPPFFLPYLVKRWGFDYTQEGSIHEYIGQVAIYMCVCSSGGEGSEAYRTSLVILKVKYTCFSSFCAKFFFVVLYEKSPHFRGRI